MTTHAWPSPPRWRTPLGLALALLVQGVWLLLLQLDRPQSQPAPKRLLTLWLLTPPSAENPPPRRQDARKEPRQARRPDADHPPPPLTVVPVVPAPITAAPSPTAPTITAAPAPLNLALPVQRAASGPKTESVISQALRDPRSNSAKRSVENAIADAAGTLPETTSDSTDGTGARLTRQGSKCTRERDSRSRVLNPMDEGLKNIPTMAGKC